jgi:A/G-specific adenine glycosylase
LRELPGVGPYTAAAVASLGFGEPVAAIDTNARRVVARVHRGVDGHDVPTRQVSALADAWLDRDDPITWNQAVMDLGREVCRPKPRCDVCPLARVCRFRLAGSIAARGHPRQGPFEGSTRQVRGAVVRSLRSHPSLTRTRLSAETGFPRDRVDGALDGLVHDGLLEFDGERVRLAGS